MRVQKDVFIDSRFFSENGVRTYNTSIQHGVYVYNWLLVWLVGMCNRVSVCATEFLHVQQDVCMCNMVFIHNRMPVCMTGYVYNRMAM